MGLKPKSISLKGETYNRVKEEAAKRGLSMRELLTVWINEKLDRVEAPVQETPSYKPTVTRTEKAPPTGSGYTEL